MRVVRYGEGQYGVVDGDVIHALTAAPWDTGGTPTHRGDSVARRDAVLLPPTVPTKMEVQIDGIGRLSAKVSSRA